MAKKRKSGKSGPIHQPYNEAMIRDFLEHLEWECRVCHAESTHLIGQLDAGLTDALAGFFRKRGSVLMLTNLWPDMPEDEANRVKERYLDIQRRRSAKAIASLRALRPIFDEALKCIEVMRATGKVPMRSIPADKVDEFLDHLENADGESTDAD